MIHRSLILATIVCAAAACGTDAPDPHGTYHVAISAATDRAFPSAIKWPLASDLTLVIDAAGHAQLTFLDSPAQVTSQSEDPDGSLHLDMATSFPGELLDPEACPGAVVFSNTYGVTFFLGFQGEHVEGTARTIANCLSSTSDIVTIVSFELSGDRAPR